MNEAPERICTSQCGKTIVQDGMKRFETDVEYIRSDVAQAMVAAACEGLVDQAAGMADGRDEARYIEDQMREAIPGASRSALHDLLKAEREKALREAAEVAAYEADFVPVKAEDFRKSILALIEKDATDG